MISPVKSLSNASVLQAMTNRNIQLHNKILSELRSIAPSIDDDCLYALYTKSISLHQGRVQNNGSFLENTIIKQFLDKVEVPYRTQVTIDKNGIITGFNQKKTRCYHNLDFVIGKDIELNRSITEFRVISCKTTCRERWTQDDWSHQLKPMKYILVTISNDYPSSERFRESEIRKIITCSPKIRDDRVYKLGFEDLCDELR